MSRIDGARSAEWYRKIYKDRSASGSVLAAVAGAPLVVPAAIGFTVWVQRIEIYVTTDAAQTITVQDTNGTPVNVLEIPASPGDGTWHRIDFGARGFGCTPDKGLSIVGTAGPAYDYVIEAYSRQTIGRALSMAEAAVAP